MKIYQVFTENKNRAQIERMAKYVDDGSTTFEARGQWKGTFEKSLVIEFWGGSFLKIHDFAKAIKELNKQQAVAIKTFDAEIDLI